MHDSQAPDRLLLRLPEAARALGLGRSTIYQLVQRGELPVVRVGRAVRVPAEALREWVARQTERTEDR
jgi:excisionase family DNA binding protein